MIHNIYDPNVLPRTERLDLEEDSPTTHPGAESDVSAVSVNPAHVGRGGGRFGGRGGARGGCTAVVTPALLHLAFLGRLDCRTGRKRLV